MQRFLEVTLTREMAEGGATLSHRAEIFRSKLIEDFQILESTSEQGKDKIPVFSTVEITSKTYHDHSGPSYIVLLL